MAKISAFHSFHSMGVPSGVVLPKPKKAAAPYYIDSIREEYEEKKSDKLLDNDLKTNLTITALNTGSLFSTYPKRGFTGSKNSTFFESLTMGVFPYITGGLTFIGVFNGLSKKFMTQDAAKAAGKYGLGMALGVIFYGVAKELSKKLISVPVAIKTGIDMNRPYRKIVNRIPKSMEEAKNEEDRKKYLDEHCLEDERGFEFHKAYESVDFPRFDLFYKTKEGQNRNEYFDYIAKKNGFGTNLNDSDQEVRPFIKEVLVKSKTAQNLSQYLWAAVGVGIGVQEPWGKLIDSRLSYKTSGLPFLTTLKRNASLLKDSAKNACKEFFNGGKAGEINPNARVAGRVLLGLAALTTVIGVYNAVRNPYMKNNKSMENSNPFKNNKKVQED